MPTSALLTKSSRDSTSLTTSIWRVAVGTDRRIWRSCRRAPKHRETVLCTGDRIDRSASMWMPRSRTARLIYRMNRSEHITDALISLH